MTVTVRPITEDDFKVWDSLWCSYIEFYEETISDKITQATWKRLIDKDVPMIGDVVEIDGHVVGFSNSVIHEATWTDKPVCYLEDLYVDENTRGKGCGRALIDNLIKRSKQEGWSRLYWHTNEDNSRARALYDSYQSADKSVRYRLFLEE